MTRDERISTAVKRTRRDENPRKSCQEQRYTFLRPVSPDGNWGKKHRASYKQTDEKEGDTVVSRTYYAALMMMSEAIFELKIPLLFAQSSYSPRLPFTSINTGPLVLLSCCEDIGLSWDRSCSQVKRVDLMLEHSARALRNFKGILHCPVCFSIRCAIEKWRHFGWYSVCYWSRG